MSDIIDDANELAELHLRAALEAHKGGTWLHYVGRCWNCDEPLEEGLFCPGGECAEDYHKRERMAR